MSTATLLASTVMNAAAALMNDAAKQIYTYDNQIPYLNLALQALQEEFELNNVPVTDEFTSDVIEIEAGVSEFGFAPDPPIADTPYLPEDFIEPKILWESPSGQNQYTPMTRLDFLPRWQEGTEINQLLNFVWQSQKIKFMPANADNDIKMDYIRSLFVAVESEDDTLNVVNAASYLEFKTAALLAKFMAENPSRAQMLDGEASEALYRSMGISTKGRQAINVRHRPFRSSYKRRTYM